MVRWDTFGIWYLVFSLAAQGRAHFKTKRVVVRGDVRNAYGEVLRVMGLTLKTILHETQKLRRQAV